MALVPRRITSAEDMRAVAHPLRLRLLELLGAEGAFTASEAARRLGESPANVSWHLRLLARHGFVRQGDGPGRTRPWKLIALGMSFGEDAEDATLATALGDLFYDHEFDVLRSSMRHQAEETEDWRDARSVVQSRLWLTADEAHALGQRVLAEFADDDLLARNQDPERRPAGARLMAVMGWVVPAGPAKSAATGSGGTEVAADARTEEGA
jgi:DNA-binding transcriptional ArsR family regulator